jgi:adenylate cyclase
MPDLIAQGPRPQDRWRRKLAAGSRQVIGRASGAWATPWDERISRRHVEICYCEGALEVEAIEGARNPVFYRGHKTEQFTLRPGDHFVIGQTTFTLADERAAPSLDMPQPAGERTFTLQELRAQPFRQADKRIDVLSRLPDIIGGSSSDAEMSVRLVNLLLSGIERATAAAVVESAIGNPQSAINVLHWDRRGLAGADFHPSERLIRQAIETGQSVAHVWSTGQSQKGGARKEGEFTVSEGVDWAFCTPLAGTACAGWGLYVTGSFASDFSPQREPDPELLRDDVKFAELTAATLSALRESRLLAARQASLGQFFSPIVLDAIGGQDANAALAPREADVTVLFCDLRGFTQESERAAGSLFDLLQRVSQALGVMTHHILEQGGVVGDFHGDAAMGFWGWPLAQPDAVERACRSALGIRNASADFRVGIGIASGRAVAGKIGTVDQVKVTVFGPVVNLASRLETMTRQLRAAILIDPPTAAVIQASVLPTIARVRRLARVRPLGMSQPLDLFELLPPAGEPGAWSDDQLAIYAAALGAFESRDWPRALQLLHQVPPEDEAKDFLTLFIARHNRQPPESWDGVIPLEFK